MEKHNRPPVYLALLHYPVQNRLNELVTTSVTNMDIHDISRSCRTYNIEKYFIVTPLEIQKTMVDRILAHWQTDKSKTYHPDRAEALSRCAVVSSFQEVQSEIERLSGKPVQVVLTDARSHESSISYVDYRNQIWEGRVQSPVVLVFGTGWGVHASFFPEVHRILAPVYGPEGVGGYNHLSVRAAVGIILDRLLGQ
jgi:hypothetical protein